MTILCPTDVSSNPANNEENGITEEHAIEQQQKGKGKSLFLQTAFRNLLKCRPVMFCFL